jgi:hypothetical protein
MTPNIRAKLAPRQLSVREQFPFRGVRSVVVQPTVMANMPGLFRTSNIYY